VQFLRFLNKPNKETNVTFATKHCECSIMPNVVGSNVRHGMESVYGRRMKPLELLEYIQALEDNRFDLVYPPLIRAASTVHWTPVPIARCAAEFLVREPGMRVLDIGCGPGKFCIVGAMATKGRFTGVEQRRHLCDTARSVIGQARIPNVEILHGNVMEIEFSNFDAFYLFNPFEENLEANRKIDTTVNLSGELYETYTEHVARQLALAPLGTRVATYCGFCQEVPMGYKCVGSGSHYRLKFWEKTESYAVRTNPMEAVPTNNKWRFMPGVAHDGEPIGVLPD
jgi:SAM-dependent methyltransferase